ncbi:acyltransferase [Bosea caraganae]|nr:acyltransferase [Bosea caraganae]
MQTFYNAEYLSDGEISNFNWAQIGNNVKIHKTCIIANSDKIFLGSNVRIDAFCILSASGEIYIEDYVHIAAGVSILGSGGARIKNFAGVSQGVRLVSSTDDFSGEAMTGPLIRPELRKVTSGQIVIGQHVVVGAGTVVLPGVTIDTGATVGALSLVNKSLAPWSIYAGTPAKRIKERKKRPLELQKEFFGDYPDQ